MAELIKTPNIADADGFYAALLETHEGLTEDESQALNARLILILSNHIGDREALNGALVLASEPQAGSG
ncbi:MAG: DUF2783 domain-containing protein [Rhodobacteraceae bacterium]|nr:DUF2783 domain-containing protein [Paracoccaceae bacterium]